MNRILSALCIVMVSALLVPGEAAAQRGGGHGGGGGRIGGGGGFGGGAPRIYIPTARSLTMGGGGMRMAPMRPSIGYRGSPTVTGSFYPRSGVGPAYRAGAIYGPGAAYRRNWYPGYPPRVPTARALTLGSDRYYHNGYYRHGYYPGYAWRYRHYRGYYGWGYPYWGYGLALGALSYPYSDYYDYPYYDTTYGDNCYWVRRRVIDRYGRVIIRRVQVCDSY